jgi:nicotinamidase/pyrazinamidase
MTMPESALIIVDVQNDFCPGGSLAVPEGDQVVPPLNTLIRRFRQVRHPIFATRDWHPEGHASFVEQGGPWPPHCVQNTAGARFHPDLEVDEHVTIISKATAVEQDAYSGFDGTDLGEQLKQQGVRKVFIGGLATDYCVKATAQDALQEGFDVYIVEDAVRGVDLRPGDSRRALDELTRAGARIVTSDQVKP